MATRSTSVELELATDRLLRCVGITSGPISIEELRESASSMFVAIFESLYRVRLQPVIRNPAKAGDYIHNARLVIQALQQSLPHLSFSHITAEGICGGSTQMIKYLVEIFQAIYDLTHSAAPATASVCDAWAP